MKQADIVVEALRKLGGCASLQQLYDKCASRFSGARSPDATIRHIVQTDGRVKRIKRGFYCLKEAKQ